MDEHDERWQRNFDAALHRQALKARAIEHKGGKCQLCKYDKCPAAMVFHHEDPQEKDFNISEVMSWERILQEIDKCILVCANCHAEIHSGYHPAYLVFEDEDRSFEPLGAFNLDETA